MRGLRLSLLLRLVGVARILLITNLRRGESEINLVGLVIRFLLLLVLMILFAGAAG